MLRSLKSASLYEGSVPQLALAGSWALYIAFCPFLGLHTIMAIGIGWILRLNIPLILTTSYLVNNPWTMIPINLAGYFSGYWILHVLFKLPMKELNPAWMSYFNNLFHTYLGFSDISFWGLMLGGNILGIILAFACYPVFYLFFSNIKRRMSLQEKL